MVDHSDRRSTLPRLIIHAGLGKSGSSAIQKYCRESTDAFGAEQALYLGMWLDRGPATAHDFASAQAFDRALGDARRDPGAFQERLATLIAAKIAAAPDTRTFIWSQIALAANATLLGPVIPRLADVCETHVVLYFRHQADWLVSGYAQWGVKHKAYEGPMRSFEDYRARGRGADYRATIEVWRGAIDPSRLHIRSYDRCDDVVADFLGVAGLGPVIAEDDATRHYETPDPALLALFRLHHGQSDASAPPGPLYRALVANDVADRHYREVDPALGLPTGEAWRAFAASFDAENEALARDFGLSLGPAKKMPAADPVIPAPAALIPPLIDLILSLDRRVEMLERKLARRDLNAD